MPPTNLSRFSTKVGHPPSLLLATGVTHGLLLGLCGAGALLGVAGWPHAVLLLACTSYALGVLGWCWRQSAQPPDREALVRRNGDDAARLPVA